MILTGPEFLPWEQKTKKFFRKKILNRPPAKLFPRLKKTMVKNPKCFCNKISSIAASKKETLRNGDSNPNFGRKYYQCPTAKRFGGCKFFIWQDDYIASSDMSNEYSETEKEITLDSTSTSSEQRAIKTPAKSNAQLLEEKKKGRGKRPPPINVCDDDTPPPVSSSSKKRAAESSDDAPKAKKGKGHCLKSSQGGQPPSHKQMKEMGAPAWAIGLDERIYYYVEEIFGNEIQLIKGRVEDIYELLQEVGAESTANGASEFIDDEVEEE